MQFSLFDKKVLFGHYGADCVRVEEVTIVDSNLPVEFNQYRILFISDLHIRKVSRREKGLNHVIKGLFFNVAIIGGDTKHKKSGLKPAVDGLSLVFKDVVAPDGVFSVLGNHEKKSEVAPAFSEIGIKVLSNQHARIPRGNGEMFIVGLEDIRYGKGDIRRASKGIPADAFKVLVCHSPDVLFSMRKHSGFNLVLSGHTHGGQVRLPFLGALFSETQYIKPKNAKGLYREENMPPIYISSGVGTTAIPLRVLCSPEITIITLKRE